MIERMNSFAQGKVDSNTMTKVENLIKSNPSMFNELYKSGINISIDAIEKIGSSGDTGILEKIVHDKTFQIIRNPYTNKTEVKCPGDGPVKKNSTLTNNTKPIKGSKPKPIPNLPVPKPNINDPLIDFPENPEFNSDDDFNNLKISCPGTNSSNGEGSIPSLVIPKNKTINIPIYNKNGITDKNGNETFDNSTNTSVNSTIQPILVNSNLTGNDIPMSINSGVISKEDSLKMRNLFIKRGINNPSSSLLNNVVNGDKNSDGIPIEHKIESGI